MGSGQVRDRVLHMEMVNVENCKQTPVTVIDQKSNNELLTKIISGVLVLVKTQWSTKPKLVTT